MAMSLGDYRINDNVLNAQAKRSRIGKQIGVPLSTQGKHSKVYMSADGESIIKHNTVLDHKFSEEARLQQLASNAGLASAVLDSDEHFLQLQPAQGQQCGCDADDFMQISDEDFDKILATVLGLHSLGIAHGDLHPANIFLHKHRASLIDFATASDTQDADFASDVARLEKRAAVSGTMYAKRFLLNMQQQGLLSTSLFPNRYS